MTGISQLLALAAALTRRAEQLCIGLEQGVADIYERVTPLTTELLRWWFGDDTCQSRRFNFHPGQRQAGRPSLLVTFLLATQEKSDSPSAGGRKLFAFINRGNSSRSTG